MQIKNDTQGETQSAKIKRLESVIDKQQQELLFFRAFQDRGILPEPDEPFFILLGRDPFASIMVEAWSFLRMAQFEQAHLTLSKLFNPTFQFTPQTPGDPQMVASFSIAQKCENWFKANRLDRSPNRIERRK